MVFMILCGLLINSSFSWGIRILIYPLNTTHVLSSKLPESVYIATNRLSYKRVTTERRIVTTVEGRALSIRAAWYHAFALARVMESLVDVARGLSPAIAIISVPPHMLDRPSPHQYVRRYKFRVIPWSTTKRQSAAKRQSRAQPSYWVSVG